MLQHCQQDKQIADSSSMCLLERVLSLFANYLNGVIRNSTECLFAIALRNRFAEPLLNHEYVVTFNVILI